ncbi:ISPsy2, transposase [Pseudomonas syringae pv. actinidiae ICMP 19072]|nr:ISPsy2, transposase [Pseudomonas syringae pv. actinidiae ICMP 19072]
MMKKMTFADAEYAGKRKQKREEHAGRKVIWQIAARRSTYNHPFRVIKRQFGYEKVRFRGLAKNTAQMVTLFALSNLWMARRHLLASAGEVRV